MSLSNLELKLISELLEMASSEFSNHGCNDFVLDATDENKDLICKIIEENGDSEWEEHAADVRSKKDKIYFYDWWLMSYFARKCKNLVKE